MLQGIFLQLHVYFFGKRVVCFNLQAGNIKEVMKIEELGLDERPREKLYEKGPEALSNSELLAILLRSGTRSMNAMDVGRNLLAEAGGKLTDLAGMSVKRMTGVPGIGWVKAVSVAAAFELGRRFSAESSTVAKIPVTEPVQVYKLMIPYLKGLRHEECWIIYLNRAGYVMKRELLSRGGLGSTGIDVITVCSKALEYRCSNVILVHNHPSSNPLPSQSDTAVTKELHDALQHIKIRMFDHVIVSDDSFYSFNDNKMYEMDTSSGYSL